MADSEDAGLFLVYRESIPPPAAKQILGKEVLGFTLFRITGREAKWTGDCHEPLQRSGLAAHWSKKSRKNRGCCDNQSSSQKPMPPKPCMFNTMESSLFSQGNAGCY